MAGHRADSTYGWLETFKVGEVVWVETTLETYANDQRHYNPPLTRRRGALKDMVFNTRLFTAVSNSKAEPPTYLIRVERTK